jgi:hypothetical protein
LNQIPESPEQNSNSKSDEEKESEFLEASNKIDESGLNLAISNMLVSSISNQIKKMNMIVEINGIYHLIPSTAKGLKKGVPLITFIDEMSSPKVDYVVEGSIREKKEYPSTTLLSEDWISISMVQ